MSVRRLSTISRFLTGLDITPARNVLSPTPDAVRVAAFPKIYCSSYLLAPKVSEMNRVYLHFCHLQLPMVIKHPGCRSSSSAPAFRVLFGKLKELSTNFPCHSTSNHSIQSAPSGLLFSLSRLHSAAFAARSTRLDGRGACRTIRI